MNRKPTICRVKTTSHRELKPRLPAGQALHQPPTTAFQHINSNGPLQKALRKCNLHQPLELLALC